MTGETRQPAEKDRIARALHDHGLCVEIPSREGAHDAGVAACHAFAAAVADHERRGRGLMATSPKTDRDLAYIWAVGAGTNAGVAAWLLGGPPVSIGFAVMFAVMFALFALIAARS